MKVSKAVEILTDIVNSKLFTPNWDVSESMKLGIEALKEYKRARGGDPLLDGELLPGETPEDDTT